MKFTGPYRFRLTIALPLVVVCFTLAAGFLPLGMIDYSIAHVERVFEVRNLVFHLKLVELGIAAAAAILSIMMSNYIVRPIEKLTKEIENLGPVNQQSGKAGEAAGRTDDEIDRLSRLYKETFVPMKGYLTTADLFLQMSEGIVSLSADGKVAFLNAPIERLLGISREKYIGKHYLDLFPNPARNSEVHEMIDDVIHRVTSRTRDILIWTPSGRDIFLRTTVSPATSKQNEPLGAVLLFEDIEEFSKLRDQL